MRFPILVQIVAQFSSQAVATPLSPHQPYINQGDQVLGLNLRFEFYQCLNLNLLRGSGSGILLNLIPEPQVQNQVQELDHSQSTHDVTTHVHVHACTQHLPLLHWISLTCLMDKCFMIHMLYFHS